MCLVWLGKQCMEPRAEPKPGHLMQFIGSCYLDQRPDRFYIVTLNILW